MKYYLIFRERIPYGWTFSKLILKLFLKQRNDKYSYIKSSLPEIERIFNAEGSISPVMIDILKLKSVLTGTDFNLYITANELMNTEILIQRMVNDQAKLSLKFKEYNELTKATWMILNLKENYNSALFLLGYRPSEINGLFPNNEFCSFDGIENLIESVYEETWLSPSQYNSMFDEKTGIRFNICRKSSGIPSLYILPDLYSKIIYSLESFIKILRKELKH